MSASSYSRVLNRNRFRMHSSTNSTAVAATATHHDRSRPAPARVRRVPPVTARTAVSRSSLMLTRPSSPLSLVLRYRGMLPSRFLFQTSTV